MKKNRLKEIVTNPFMSKSMGKVFFY